MSILLLAAVILTSCGQNAELKWQAQYDLGVRYLLQGSYEEAIIAFAAAIEIAPRRAEAYEKAAKAYLHVRRRGTRGIRHFFRSCWKPDWTCEYYL